MEGRLSPIADMPLRGVLYRADEPLPALQKKIVRRSPKGQTCNPDPDRLSTGAASEDD